MPFKSYKLVSDDIYVHVLPNKSFLLSKGMLNDYMFHIVPNDHNNQVRPIHMDALPMRMDQFFNQTIKFLLTLGELSDFDLHNTLRSNNYIIVLEDFGTHVVKKIILGMTSYLPENNTNHDDWEYLGYVKVCNQPERPIYKRNGTHYLYKYDSPQSNIAVFPYCVHFEVQEPTGLYIHVDDDSYMNIELPYPMFGNLINTIRIDDKRHCINDKEYYKYCQLAPMLIEPQYERRKPIQ